MVLKFPRITRAVPDAVPDDGVAEFEIALRVFRELCQLQPAAATRVLNHVGEALEDRKQYVFVDD